MRVRNQYLRQKPVFLISLLISTIFRRENGFLETFFAIGEGIDECVLGMLGNPRYAFRLSSQMTWW